MPYLIDNDDVMTYALTVEMTSIIDVIVDKLLIELKKKIQKIVYDAYKPKMYDRQGEQGGLLGEWLKTSDKPVVNGNNISSGIEEMPGWMIPDPENFIHGSVGLWVMDDIRELLTEIITEGKTGRHFDFAKDLSFKEPRDFWQAFIDLLDSGKVDELIEFEFNSRGIVYIKS
jgi:hypothetical protein